MEINLLKFRNSVNFDSTVYAGINEGKKARKELNIDDVDDNDDKITFIIPEYTTSFNPSFYIGLLFDSYKKLGIKKCKEKYNFDIQTKSTITKHYLIGSLDDGDRNCIDRMNSYNFQIKRKQFIKKRDKIFYILLIIEILLVFGISLFGFNDIFKQWSSMSIVFTIGVWYIFSIFDNKKIKINQFK